MNAANPFADSILQNATGKLTFQLTNDYLFRATLQHSNEALKGLICALLHLKAENVISVLITNPIELGKSIDNKDYFLDIRVLLNNNITVNIEMQILNRGNWPERSLQYLCRTFDQLSHGQNYNESRPVIQISILDFTLFPEVPEFYATYMFMNVKNQKIYTDKVRLSVLDLKQIGLATDEDKSYQIDYWARLFKATTWEEIKMLAKDNKALKQAAESAYILSADEMVRLQCQAREDYYRDQRFVQNRLDQAILDRDEYFKQVEEQKQELAKQKQELAKQKQELSEKDSQITHLLAEIEKFGFEKEGN